MPLLESQSFDESTTQIAGERRSKARYALDLAVEYRVVGYPEDVTRTGRIIDISSLGIAFTTSDRLTRGEDLVLSIGWPILLNGNCSLKLVVEGKVVRSSPSFAAIRFRRHEFRTQARRRAAGH